MSNAKSLYYKFLLAFLLALLVPLAGAYSQVPGNNANTAYRILRGVSLPPTCNPGDVFFVIGTGPFVCSTTNTWAGFASSGTGDVVGPASSTDNAITRFNGTTGKSIQNSTVTLGDTGILSGATIGTGNTLGSVTVDVAGTDALGDIYYRDNSGILTRLGIGSSGNVLTVAGGIPSWAAPGVGAQNTNYYNVVNDFGAVCNGIANDTTPIQNAANAAAASSTRKTIFIPGDCLVTGITLTGPVVLLGGGQGSIIRSNTNAPIIDMVADGNFVGGTVTNLKVVGSVSAGSNQHGIRMDNATGALRFTVEDVLIENVGGDGLYWGKAFSSFVNNVRISDSAGYNFHYNAPNQPSNVAANIYVGRVRATQPVAYYIEAGDFTGYNLNGIDNVLAGSIWMQVGTTTSPATAILNGFNAESWTSRGFKVQSSSAVVLDGVSLIVGDGGTAAASKIGIEFTLNGDGSTFFAPLIKRSKIGDAVNFADGLAAYNNSQPIQAPGFAPIDVTGLGPQIGSTGNLTTYRNTTTSSNQKLARSDARWNKTTITSNTTLPNIGANYFEVDSSSGPIELRLEWPGWAVPGTPIIIKDTGGAAATNNITIRASGGGTVNGSEFVMQKNGEAVVLMPDGNALAGDFRVVARSLATIGDVSKVAAAAVTDYFPYWNSFGQLTSQGPIYRLSNSLVILESLLNNSNNLYDIGSLSSNRFRTAYLGTSVDVGINSSTTGSIVLRNSTNANATTIQPGTPSSAITFTLPATLPASAGCLQVSNTGVITQTGSACGSGGGSGIPTIGSSTDTALVRWSGTGGNAVSNSTALLSNAGDLTLNADSSTTGSPRTFGFANLSASEAIRIQYGDPYSGIQNVFSGRTQIFSYWGAEVRGSRQTLTSPSFTTGAATDPSLEVFAETNGIAALRTSALLNDTVSLQVNATTAGMLNTTNLAEFNYLANNTNAPQNIISYNVRSGTTPANNFGLSETYYLESTTTDNREAFRQDVLWTDATDASRSSAVIFNTVSSGGSLTERFRVSGAAVTASAPFTATSTATLGVASSVIGQLIFKNSVNGNNTVLQPGTPGSSITFTLPATLPASAGCLEVSNTGVITQTGSACGSGGGGVTGSGTANSIPKWSSSTALTDSGITDTGTTITVLPVAASSGSNRQFAVRNPGASGLTASTEVTSIQLGGDGSLASTTMSHATGAITTNRDLRIIPVTHAFVGSSTVTNAITLEASSPIAGTNATLTNSVVARLLPSAAAHQGLWIENVSGSATGDLLRLTVGGINIVRFIPNGGDLNSVFSDGALGTTATDGFVYLPSMAGVPSGVPTAYTGTVPVAVDTTNNRFYGYAGGAWRNLTGSSLADPGANGVMVRTALNTTTARTLTGTTNRITITNGDGTAGNPTFDIGTDVVTLTGTQTLTNKTLTSPVISTIVNTGTLTLPTSTDTLVGRATTDTLTNKTLSTGTAVSASISFTAGVRQTFAPNATTPGLNVGSVAGDPSTPSNADIWYDSTNNLLRARINGATVSLGAGGGGSPGGSSGNLQWNNSSSFAGVSGSTVTSLGYLTLAPTASTSGSPSLFTITGPAHTTLAADTEATDINLNLARTVQFTGGAGAFTTQRAMRIQAPTYSASSTETITNAVTLEVASPSAGTNMTLTNSYGLRAVQTAAAHVPVAITLASSPTGDALQLINSSGTAILALTSDGYVVNGSTLSQSNYTIKNSSGSGGFELDGFSGALYLVPRGGPAAGNNFIFRTPSEVDYIIFNSSVRGIGVNVTPTTAGHFVSNSTSAGSVLAVSAAGATTQTFEIQHTGSETNAVSLVNLISNNSNGTAATGFGQRTRHRLETSTTNDTTAVEQDVLWSDATHASRTSRYAVRTVNNATTAETWGVQGNQNYGAAEFDRGNSTGAFTIDWNNGNNQKATATGNWTTVTFSNIKVGAQYTLRVVQDATGGRTWTPPTTMKFPGGVSGNVLTGTANAQDLFICVSTDGTNLYCNGLFDVKNP